MHTKSLVLLALALSSPAWAGGHGHPGGSHGAMVSQTAHAAHMNGQPVGSSVRNVARSKSQGPAHASANGITHANGHSVLAGATPSGKHAGKAKGHSHNH
ncbi:MAG TPA: hypothetical protein VN599_05690 [Rudaea sp.]|nr:hypothetical protein [Rudaea sp.]